jgi:hypothetical protein
LSFVLDGYPGMLISGWQPLLNEFSGMSSIGCYINVVVKVMLKVDVQVNGNSNKRETG